MFRLIYLTRLGKRSIGRPVKRWDDDIRSLAGLSDVDDDDELVYSRL